MRSVGSFLGWSGSSTRLYFPSADAWIAAESRRHRRGALKSRGHVTWCCVILGADSSFSFQLCKPQLTRHDSHDRSHRGHYVKLPQPWHMTQQLVTFVSCWRPELRIAELYDSMTGNLGSLRVISTYAIEKIGQINQLGWSYRIHLRTRVVSLHSVTILMVLVSYSVRLSFPLHYPRPSCHPHPASLN